MHRAQRANLILIWHQHRAVRQIALATARLSETTTSQDFVTITSTPRRYYKNDNYVKRWKKNNQFIVTKLSM